MRFGKQPVEIDLTDVKAGRFLSNAEDHILGIVLNMVRNNQIDTDRRILEIKVRRITPNRYGNDVMRKIKLKAYIKLLLKINPNASNDYLDLSDYLTINGLDLLFALDKLYDTRIG